MSDIKSCSFFENKNGGDINDYLLVSCLGNGDDFGLSQRAFADMLLTKTSSIPGFINVLDVFYHKEIYPEKGDLSIDYIFVITNPITQLTIEDFMELEKEERLDFAFNQVLPKVLARVKYLHDRNITFRGRLQLENIFRTDFFDGIALTVPASFNEDELNAYKELTETWAIDNSTHEVCPAPERWLKTYKEKPKDKNEEVERYKAMDIFAIGLLFIRMLSNDFRHTKSTIAVFPLINLLFELDSSHVQDDIVEQRTDGVVQKKSSSVDLTVNNIRLTDEYLDFLRYTLCPIAGARLTADQLLQRFFNDARTVLPVKTLDAHHPTIKFEPKNYCNQLGPLFYFYSRFHQEPSLRKLAFLQFLSKDNVERAKEMEIMKPEFKAAISEFHGPFFPLFFKFVSNLDTKQKDPILAMAEKDFPKMGGHKAK